MRIGLYQFAGSGDVPRNQAAILRGIAAARAQGVRLLVFQECAVCGYPRVEASTDLDSMDHVAIERCVSLVQQKAKEAGLYIALGTIRRENAAWYNSILLFGPEGERIGHYDKRALWGADKDIFTRGNSPGVFVVDGIVVGLRICFEVRFPEYFRELYKQQVQLCCVSLCDVAEGTEDASQRSRIIAAHLLTRAVENGMVVASVNSLSRPQTAPTAVFDVNGQVVASAQADQEELLVYDYKQPEMSFGLQGRHENIALLLGECAVDKAAP